MFRKSTRPSLEQASRSECITRAAALLHSALDKEGKARRSFKDSTIELTMRQRTLDRHVLVILLFGLSNVVQARSWSEIQPLQDSEPRDSAGIAYLAGTDALIAHSSPPTTSPSSSIQTASPTITSTVSPGFTRSATYTPTTKMPSYTSSYITSAANLQTTYSSPPTTSAPTTRLPSSPAPTPPVDPYPPIQTPLFPEAWYFNYDTRSQSLYGPGYPSLQIVNNQPLMGYNNNAWAGVSNPPHYYWNEFTDTNGYGPWKGVLQNYDVSRNMCGRVGLQSPIDIQASGATCIEHHQIRSRVSTHSLFDDPQGATTSQATN
jgi:hypothetical protein